MENMNHENNEGARHQFMEFFDGQTVGNKWMAAVWSIEDGKIKLGLTTFEFPTGSFDKSEIELTKRLAEYTFVEKEETKPVLEPLPLAKDFQFFDKDSPAIQEESTPSDSKFSEAEKELERATEIPLESIPANAEAELKLEEFRNPITVEDVAKDLGIPSYLANPQSNTSRLDDGEAEDDS